MSTESKHTPGALEAFGFAVLAIMEADDDWSGDTLEAIKGEAEALLLAGSDDDGNFKSLASAPSLLASNAALRAALEAAVAYLESNRPKGKTRDIFTQLNEYENSVMKPARAALAEGGAIISGKKPKVVVIVEGGIVQDVLSDSPVDCALVDYDIEGSERELTLIPVGRGETQEAVARLETVTIGSNAAEIYDTVARSES